MCAPRWGLDWIGLESGPGGTRGRDGVVATSGLLGWLVLIGNSRVGSSRVRSVSVYLPLPGCLVFWVFYSVELVDSLNHRSSGLSVTGLGALHSPPLG